MPLRLFFTESKSRKQRLFGLYTFFFACRIQRCERFPLFYTVTFIFVEKDTRAEIDHTVFGFAARTQQYARRADLLRMGAQNITAFR